MHERQQLAAVAVAAEIQRNDSAPDTFFKTRCRCPLMEELRKDFVERESKFGSGKEHNKLLTEGAPVSVPMVKLLHDSTVSARRRLVITGGPIGLPDANERHQFGNENAAACDHENPPVFEAIRTILAVLATGYHFVYKSKNVVATNSFENRLAGHQCRPNVCYQPSSVSVPAETETLNL
jgi:hypothetical protein